MGRILLLEDDDEVRSVLCQAVEGHGHDVKPVANCADAYAALKEEKFDLLLSDVRLPDGSGHEVAAHAKSTGTPALLISAYADEFKNTNPDQAIVFPKPSRLDPIVRAIDGILLRR